MGNQYYTIALIGGTTRRDLIDIDESYIRLGVYDPDELDRIRNLPEDEIPMRENEDGTEVLLELAPGAELPDWAISNRGPEPSREMSDFLNSSPDWTFGDE
jgi:hypothetical protein